MFKAGIITDGLTRNEIDHLTQLQTAPPRQMHIFVTQSDFILDMYRDFTCLETDLGVDVIIIYPAGIARDTDFIKKICMMSRRKKVPVVAMEDAWIDSGAMLVFC